MKDINKSCFKWSVMPVMPDIMALWFGKFLYDRGLRHERVNSGGRVICTSGCGSFYFHYFTFHLLTLINRYLKTPHLTYQYIDMDRFDTVTLYHILSIFTMTHSDTFIFL